VALSVQPHASPRTAGAGLRYVLVQNDW